MFRPPPTVIEIGTEEDVQQFEEIMHQRSPESPIKVAPTRLVFDSPDIPPKKQVNGLVTPQLSLSGSFNSPL